MTENTKYYWAREQATLALVAVEEGMWAKEAIDNYGKKDQVVKALFTEIVYGTLQNLLFLDHVLSFYLKRPLQKLTPHIRNILRSALYQLHFLDRVPHSQVIYDAVRLAGRYGHKGVQGFVNGVLNSFLREQKWHLPESQLDLLSIQYSHPKWLVERWVEDIGVNDTEQLLKWNNNRHPLCVRVNTLVITPQEYVRLLEEQKIEYLQDAEIDQALLLPKSGNVTELPLFFEGAVQPQSKASMLTAFILGAKPNESIADLCAAPGTKTSHIAELMENTGELIAVDISSERLELARTNLERLKVKNVEFIEGDATNISLPKFDRVLVDAPCSGLGTLSHRPDARYQKTEKSLEGLPELQLAILSHAASLVKQGGVLVYSTCTTETKENSGVITRFLERESRFSEDENIPTIAGLIKQKHGFQSYPHKTDTDGFYFCRLKNHTTL
ncbi:MAG: 16S rRNA (cytosine(967)-C(5))-methyltransferase RsmB [Bacillota bacterium]